MFQYLTDNNVLFNILYIFFLVFYFGYQFEGTSKKKDLQRISADANRIPINKIKIHAFHKTLWQYQLITYIFANNNEELVFNFQLEEKAN